MIFTEALEVHDTLNPKLWDENDHLHDDVKNRILAIVDEFTSDLDFSLRVADIYLVGSNASYNYTEYSDLDVHIVTNFDTYDADPTILQILFNALKSNFNNNYDIKIKGIDVELYVEDMSANTTSNGIYSVSRGDWIKHPQPIEIPDVDVTLSVHALQDQIDEALKSNDVDKVNEMIDHLYLLRKEGLMREGEYSEGNLIFKEIRNLGLLDALKSEAYRLQSKELSLEKKMTESTVTIVKNPTTPRAWDATGVQQDLMDLLRGTDYNAEITTYGRGYVIDLLKRIANKVKSVWQSKMEGGLRLSRSARETITNIVSPKESKSVFDEGEFSEYADGVDLDSARGDVVNEDWTDSRKEMWNECKWYYDQMMNHGHWEYADEFLCTYSQYELELGGTRGYNSKNPYGSKIRRLFIAVSSLSNEDLEKLKNGEATIYELDTDKMLESGSDDVAKADYDSLPKYLYHATFEEFLDDIQEHGLGAKSHRNNMSGSDYSGHPIYSNDGIFLAVDYQEALAYVETDDRSDSPIVLLRIPKSILDKDSIYVDTNNLSDGYDDMGVEVPDNVKTYFYSGIIHDPINKVEVIDL